MGCKMANWTAAQEAAITEKSSKILVSAAAGSGKTSVMIERVARLICGGEQLEGMAICTFTKRAAADMKLKLTNKLKALAAQNTCAERALKSIAQADISTLHSWCSKLIKTYFYAVNVDPNFEIMPEASQKLELARAIEKVIGEQVLAADEAFIELYDILRSGRKHSALAKLVKRIFEQAVSQPDPQGFLQKCTIQEHSDEYYMDILIAQKAPIEESYATEEQTLKHVRVLVRLANAVMERYSAVKDRKAWLDYADLEQQTLKLLRSDYAGLVKSKYKYIFIDEYQDINPLQEELLKLDTNMFYVGDVKQSIYGFRMCAPEFFMAKREDYITNGTGKALELNKNWRSDNKILQFVNKVFNKVMTLDFGKVDYLNVAAFEDGSDIYENSVVFSLVKLQGKKENTDEPKMYSVINHDYGSEDFKAEQKLILQHILYLITTTIPDENGEARAVNFSDIAILVRTRDDYAFGLMTLLKSAGIDCSFTDSTSISAHKYIGFLIDYLRLIDNSRDDISLAAVMLQFGEFTNAELSEVRISAGDNCSFFEAVSLYASKTEHLGVKINQFMQKVQHYRQLSASVDANYLCQTLVTDYDYFKTVYAAEGENEAQALAQMLESVENSPYNASLYEYLQSLDVDSNDLSVLEKANSVRVMTIHAAKGLEFPFVIMANLSKKFDWRDLYEKMLVSERGISLKYFNYFSHTTTLTAKMALELIRLKNKLMEEEMRILYVALTRPIYQLAIFGSYAKEPVDTEPQNAKNYLDWLWGAGGEYLVRYEEQDCLSDLTAPEPKIIFKKPNAALVEKIKNQINFTRVEEHLPVKTNVSKILADSESAAKIIYTAGGEGDDRALERGTAYHKVMELLDFDAPFAGEWDRILKEYPLAILADCAKIERAAVKIKQLTLGAKIYRELPFVYNATSLIQGVIDLLILRGESIIIVDYKTTRLENLTKENYGEQLSLYAMAAQNILGVKVDKKLLYSFEKGDFVEL